MVGGHKLTKKRKQDLNKLVSHGQKVGGISISDLKRRGMPKWMDGVLEQVEQENIVETVKTMKFEKLSATLDRIDRNIKKQKKRNG